jgi:hypothetical protein
VVSGVADRPCYRWIIHGDNNSLRPPDPTDYYGALRRVLDSVDRWPHDEATKDYARTMWLRTTVLDRFGRGGALSWPADYREELFRHARAITAERLPERLDPGLPALHRVRAALLRADDLPALLDYVRVDGTVTTRPELVAARSAGNTLTLTVRTQLVSEAGPVLFVREGSRVRQRPTGPLDPAVADRVLDVTDDLAAGRIDVMLTERSTNAGVVPANHGDERPCDRRRFAWADPHGVGGPRGFDRPAGSSAHARGVGREAADRRARLRLTGRGACGGR